LTDVDRLRAFLDDRLGGAAPISVDAMAGGGSCDIFAVDRESDRWVLRRAPSHRSSATAHDVLREFRILDAIKDAGVRIARPLLACADPEVFGGPFYMMERIEGMPVRSSIPERWGSHPEDQHLALEELVDALVAVHAVDWNGVGLADLARPGPFLERQVGRWMSQLDSYGGRPLPVAERVGEWLESNRPTDQEPVLAHGDYKIDNVLFAESSPPELLAVVDWEMALIGDPLVDLAWALIFHPDPDGTMPLGLAGQSRFDCSQLPSAAQLIARYADASGRDVSAVDWYHVFARWKLAIVLEGSYAKFLRGDSQKPIHEHFGAQVDRLLDHAAAVTGAL
jgi:aminoglycoside phosphotransferase (APT) family kinase protein